MYIERLKREGQAWLARRRYYKDEDSRLDNEYNKNVKAQNDKISACRASIQTLSARASECEKKIPSLMRETYQNAVFTSLNGVLSAFGITFSEQDKSSELEAEKKALAGALISKKQNEQEIDKCNNTLTTLKANVDKSKQALRDSFKREKQAMLDKLVPEYNQKISRRVPRYTTSSQAPTPTSTIPETLALGNQRFEVNGLEGILPDTKIIMPYEVDIKKEGNFIINISADDTFNDKLEKCIVGIILRYMESFPATKLHLGMFSSTISSLSRAEALYRAMKEGKCTILDDVVDSKMEIKNLLDRIDVCSRGPADKMIKNGCKSIYELYSTGKDMLEPFHLIVLHGALAEISDENLLKLYSLMKGNHSRGMRFVIIDDMSSVNTRNSKSIAQALEQISKLCTRIDFNGGAPTINGIETAVAPMADDFDSNYVYAYCKDFLAKKAAPPYLSYEEIGFGKEKKDPKEYEKITIPVGKSGANNWSIGFSCVASSSNPVPIANLILGVPGTGKTKLIDAMIYNAAIKYSPDDVIFHLLDFKDGSMSQGYLLEENKIPHVKVVSAKNDAEEADFILTNIIEENRSRVNEFTRFAAEQKIKIDSIADYNRAIDERKLPIKKMPRLIIAIDECQTLFDTDSLAAKAEDIIRKGRSQGIHILLATQAMTTSMRKAVKFIEGLYIFQSVKDDIDAVLDKQYRDRVNDEVPRGSFSAFASNDQGKTCEKVRVSFYGPKLADYARAIRDKWSNHSCDIVQIGENSKLDITSVNYKQLLLASGHFNVPLGESYQNRQNAFFSMKEEKLKPTLLLGGSEELATSLCTSVMLSAKRSKSPIYAVDVSQMQSLARIKRECFPNEPSISVGAGKDYTDFLGKVYKIFLERQEQRNENPSMVFDPVTFIINGAHEIPDFAKDARLEYADAPVSCEPKKEEKAQDADDDILNMSLEDLFGDTEDEVVEVKEDQKPNEPIKLKARESLLELIEKGKKLGIYICIWIDDVDNSTEKRHYKDNCGVKVIFPSFKSGLEGYMNDGFNEKMVRRINSNMALVEHSMDSICVFKKIRVYQYNLDNKDLIDFIKKL